MLLDTGLARQIKQQLLRRAIDQVLGQVGKHMGRGLAERLKTAGLCGKRGTQIEGVATGIESGLQCAPSGRAVTTRAVHDQAASSSRSSLTASTQNARMPSDSFSVAIASSLRAKRKPASS